MSNEKNTTESNPTISWKDIVNVKIKDPNYKPKDSNGNPIENKVLRFLTVGKKGVGKTYKFRLIGAPIGFYQFSQQIEGAWRNVKIAFNENDAENPSYQECSLYTSHGIVPERTYAINVLNREDGLLYILQGKISIFETFFETAKVSGRDIGQVQGCDFTLEVTGQKGKDYYKCNFSSHNKLTPEEIAYVKGNKYGLNRIFKMTNIDEAEEALFNPKPKQAYGNSSSNPPFTPDATQKTAAPAAQTPKPAVTQAVTVAPTNKKKEAAPVEVEDFLSNSETLDDEIDGNLSL